MDSKIEKRNTTLGWIVCLGIWMTAVAVFFAPSVFGGKIIAPLDVQKCFFRPFAEQPYEGVHNHYVSDSVSQYLPYKYSMYRSYKEDGYVGWNPYTHNGCAISENTMTSPGDPLNYLYAFLPFWTAWDLGVMLQFFIAGVGIMLLMRYCKMPFWAALLAAISFAFYSQFITWMYHKWVGAMIWAPFLVWALLKFKQYWVNVPAIIFMALAWRTGHLQACTFAFILVACVWLDAVWKKDGQWPSRQEFIKVTVSYLLTGVVGALLSLDYFVETLARMEGCKTMPFLWGWNHLLSLISMLFPSTFGEPATHGCLGNAFQINLFDVRYGGFTACVLALIACFNKRAPRVAKIIFIVSFILASTPLITYIYARSTVVMGLGMAWLAAWQLYDFTRVSYPSVYLKRIVFVILGIGVLWLIGSLGIYVFYDTIAAKLKEVVYNATIFPTARVEWQNIRVDRMLQKICLWHWKNIIFFGAAVLGVVLCYKIKPGSGMNRIWVSGVVLIAFVEVFVYSLSWVSYSDKPEGKCIYNTPSWMAQLKEIVKDGSLQEYRTTVDRDFWCQNQLSVYDIHLADGYETFQPVYLKPAHRKIFDTKDRAMAGISHILADTKWKEPNFPQWKEVMSGKDFKVYANPDYKGRYFINESTPIKKNWRTCNRIHISVPAEAETLTVLESYHKGWKAYAGQEELEITPTERGGMHIKLPSSEKGMDVLLEFRMPYRYWYYSIISLTSLILLFIWMKQKRTIVS